jgi:hypothetical protein
MSNKPTCVLQAPVFTRSGYGDWSLAIAKSLLRYDKFDLLIAPTPWGGTPKKNHINEFDQNDKETLAIVDRVLKAPLGKQPDLFIQITIPNEFQAVGKYNIGMTAGIETTIPPGEWIEGLNKMNLNITTSEFSKNVFTSAQFVKNYSDGRQEPLKVEKPLEVCFWGADTNIYKKTDEKIDTVEAVLNKIPEKTAFLFVGQWTNLAGLYSDRKDIGNLIRVFCNIFKDRKGDRPCLILKTSGINFSKMDKDACLSRIKQIQQNVGGNVPNIYLLHGELSDVEMNALYNHSKVKAHLSFTHGEGYGHPLLLSTLSGKPLFVSNWSGHLDFLNPKYANLLDGSVKTIAPEAVNQWLIKESGWFTVAYGLAEERIKSAFYDNDKKLIENAEQLRLENMTKFSLSAMDAKFHGYLDKYVPVFQVEKQIILPKLKKITLPK